MQSIGNPSKFHEFSRRTVAKDRMKSLRGAEEPPPREMAFFGEKREYPMEKETWIVVGLGNPGLNYAHTRHNVGFEVTDILSRRWNAPLTKKRCKGLLAETVVDGRRVVLCQPQTYMNLSGECVEELLQWYKVPLDHLLIIYDDIDLPHAKLRVRKTGSAGTP